MMKRSPSSKNRTRKSKTCQRKIQVSRYRRSERGQPQRLAKLVYPQTGPTFLDLPYPLPCLPSISAVGPLRRFEFASYDPTLSSNLRPQQQSCSRREETRRKDTVFFPQEGILKSPQILQQLVLFGSPQTWSISMAGHSIGRGIQRITLKRQDITSYTAKL